jgi:hypothetical protein
LDLKILEASQGLLIVFVCSVLDRLFVVVWVDCDAIVWNFWCYSLIFDFQVRNQKMCEGKVFGFENRGGQPGIVDRFCFVLYLIADVDGFWRICVIRVY